MSNTPTAITENFRSADMGAYQGVARSPTRFFTSAYPDTSNAQFTLNMWGVDGDGMPDTSAVLGTRDCGSDAPGGLGAISQINGIYYHAVDGFFYVTCNKFSNGGPPNYVLVYDPATFPSAPIATHALGAGAINDTVEGVTWSALTGSWWVFYHNKPQLEEYNTSWVLQNEVTLPMSPGIMDSLWNGGFWDDSTLYLTPHNENTDNNVWVYRYNGTSYPRFTILNKLPHPRAGAGQGMFYDGTTLYMAERPGDTGRVLGCSISYSGSTEPLLFSPTGALFFNATSQATTLSETKCENTTATGLAGTQHSIVLWLKSNGLNTRDSTTRVITLGSADTQFRIYWDYNTAKFYINRSWTGAGLWSIPQPSHNDTTWLGFGITYDGTSTANNPLVWMRHLGTELGVVARTVTTETAPTGTITALGNGYTVGNMIGSGRGFDGAIAYVQVWQGTILTKSQINAALDVPGSVPGAALYLPLTDRLPLGPDGFDLSGNGYHATISNGSLVLGPPRIPVSLPRGRMARQQRAG